MSPRDRTRAKKVNLVEKFARFHELWRPKIIAEVNDFQVKLVKLQGTFPWHRHPDEDELFLVIRGRMVIHFRDHEIPLETGELVVVPRGQEHRPEAAEEVWAFLLELSSTVNTGSAGGARTTAPEWI